MEKEHCNLHYIFQEDKKIHAMPEHRLRQLLEYLNEQLRLSSKQEESM